MPPLHGLGYRLVRWSSLPGETICKAHCEREDGVGGVGEAGGREDRAAADVDVARAVEKKVGGHDAVGGRGRHAHAAHVVIAVVAAVEEGCVVVDECGVGLEFGYGREGTCGDL